MPRSRYRSRWTTQAGQRERAEAAFIDALNTAAPQAITKLVDVFNKRMSLEAWLSEYRLDALFIRNSIAETRRWWQRRPTGRVRMHVYREVQTYRAPWTGARLQLLRRLVQLRRWRPWFSSVPELDQLLADTKRAALQWVKSIDLVVDDDGRPREHYLWAVRWQVCGETGAEVADWFAEHQRSTSKRARVRRISKTTIRDAATRVLRSLGLKPRPAQRGAPGRVRRRSFAA
ncbi:MAG: hypothetical protein QM723_05300 [Myxococcaceae bacterium]